MVFSLMNPQRFFNFYYIRCANIPMEISVRSDNCIKHFSEDWHWEKDVEKHELTKILYEILEMERLPLDQRFHWDRFLRNRFQKCSLASKR